MMISNPRRLLPTFVSVLLMVSQSAFSAGNPPLIGEATVIASDRFDRRAQGPELALQQPGETDNAYWQADVEGGRKWLEFTWRFPVRMSGLAFTILQPTACRGFVVEALDLPTGQWRAVHREPTAGEVHTIRFPQPVETSQLRLLFETGKASSPAGTLRLADMRFFSAEHPLRRPGWEANWIWGSAEGWEKTPPQVWLRRTFEVEAMEHLESAWLQCAVDDLAGIHLNGQTIGKAAGTRTVLYDIRPHLVPGRNVIAVDLRDTGGAFGFLAELCLNYRDGERVRSEKIGSDTAWKSSTKLATGWFKPEFNDSAWEPAVLLHDDADAGPWGRINYTPKAISPDAFTLEKMVFTPATVTPRTWVTADLTLMPQRTPTEDYGFELEMTAGEETAPYDTSVAKASTWPKVPTSRWQPGVSQTVSARIWIGDFAPDGKVDIALRAFGGGTSARVQVGKETEGRLKIHRLDPKAPREAFPRVEIRQQGEGCALVINGEPVPPVVMTQFSISNRAMAAYSEAGFEIYRLGTTGRVITVPEEQEATLEEWLRQFDDQVARLDGYAPEAWLILSVMLRVSPDWAARYPQEVYLAGNGERGGSHSMASGQWRKDSAEIIRRLIAHVEGKPWGRRVIGYTFMAGGGGEFHQYGPTSGMVPREEAFTGDFSPAALSAFRSWLKERYQGNPAALAKAWKREGIDFATATPESRRLVAPGEFGFFRDPAVAQDALDYFLWYSEHNAENLAFFCRVGKEATRSQPIFGGYYGYLVSKMLNQKPGGNHLGGHNALDALLKSDALDFISLPYSYSDRTGGTPFFQNTPQQSMTLNGKLLLAEYDNRTFAAGLRDYPQSSLAETVAIQRRDIGASLATGAGWWWLDFSRGSGGQQSIPYFAHPEVVRDMRRSRELYREVLRRPLSNKAQVAVVIDGRSSMLLDLYASIPAYNLIKRSLIRETSAIGAPVDYINLADIEKERVQKQYKMFVFLNAYHLDAAHREIIRTRLQRDQKHLVWIWAPGLSGRGEGLQVAGMNEVTGMEFEANTDWADPAIDPVEESGWSTPLTLEDWDISHFRNRAFYEKRLAPRFRPVDGDLRVLGRWRADRSPAVAVKAFGPWTSVYVGTPFVSTELLRLLARDAGVHLYTDEPIGSLHAGNGMISLHAHRSEPFRGMVRWQGAAQPFDAFTGEALAPGPVEALALEVEPAGTRTLLLSEPAGNVAK